MDVIIDSDKQVSLVNAYQNVIFISDGPDLPWRYPKMVAVLDNERKRTHVIGKE